MRVQHLRIRVWSKGLRVEGVEVRDQNLVSSVEVGGVGD